MAEKDFSDFLLTASPSQAYDLLMDNTTDTTNPFTDCEAWFDEHIYNGPVNGKDYCITVADEAPEWLAPAIYKAHDGALPCNYIHEMAMLVCYEMQDNEESTPETIADYLSQTMMPWALFDWMRYAANSTEWMDIVLADGWTGGYQELCRCAYYGWVEHIANIIINAAKEA